MNTKWHICGVDELPLDKRLKFSVLPDIHVIVVNHKGKYVAFEHKCPHKGARMDNSLLAEDTIVCPPHKYEFDMNSGVCKNNVCPALKIYPVTVEGNNLFLHIPSFLNGGG